MKWKKWKEWSTKASDASKRGSLVVSNPRCLISQIAVTFDEGDRAGVRRETGPVRDWVCVFVFFCWCVQYRSSCALRVWTNPSLNTSCVVYSSSLPPDTILSLPTLPLFIWHCLLSYLLYVLLIRCTIPPAFYSRICMLSHVACTYTHAYTSGNIGERKKKECVCVCAGESLWGLVLYSAGVSWLVACRLMCVYVCVHTHMCKQRRPHKHP